MQIKWYYRPVALLIEILCIGPFALPLVWLSPALKKSHKIIITILVAILTVALIKSSIVLYSILLERLKELQEVLGG